MVEEKNWGSRLFDVANHVLLILFGAACLFPMIHMLAVSFSDRAASTRGFVTVWPIRFTMANYVKIFQARAIYAAAWVSVQRTAVGTLLNLLLTILTAYPLSKSAQVWKGRSIFVWIVVFSMFFGGGLIPWFLVIRSLGLLNMQERAELVNGQLTIESSPGHGTLVSLIVPLSGVPKERRKGTGPLDYQKQTRTKERRKGTGPLLSSSE